MEIKAYNDLYLPYVSESMGIMFEHAVNIGIDPKMFWLTFINSAVAKKIEMGHPKYLSASGLDYLLEIYDGKREIPCEERITVNQYYWAAWALAHYQQKTGRSFSKINMYLPIEEVLRLYPTLHEADITKFYDVADNYFKKPRITNLKMVRQFRELSQRELSVLSSVDLRSIQMYEQRRNDINKAQAETLYKLSKAIGCRIEDILED